MKGIAAVLLCAAMNASAADAPARKVDFQKEVLPILKSSCLKCHGVDPDKPKKKPAAGFSLADRAAALKGGRSGAAIVPGNAKDSLFYKLLGGPVPRPVPTEDDKEIDPMPKAKRGEKWKSLPADQVETLKLWIDQGAAWTPEP